MLGLLTELFQIIDLFVHQSPGSTNVDVDRDNNLEVDSFAIGKPKLHSTVPDDLLSKVDDSDRAIRGFSGSWLTISAIFYVDVRPASGHV